MTQPLFDFTSPGSGRPEQEPVAPFQPGSHTSWTGSRQAVKTLGWKTSEILQLLASGPKSRQELAAIGDLSINVVCPIVNGLLKRGVLEKLPKTEGEIVTWPDGGTTSRERLRIKGK